jgi:hypothetical protein
VRVGPPAFRPDAPYGDQALRDQLCDPPFDRGDIHRLPPDEPLPKKHRRARARSRISERFLVQMDFAAVAADQREVAQRLTLALAQKPARIGDDAIVKCPSVGIAPALGGRRDGNDISGAEIFGTHCGLLVKSPARGYDRVLSRS